MPQLTKHDAEKLSPEQATAVVHVLDLQAKWDGLLAEQGHKTSDLHARQRANDVHLAALRGYSAKYGNANIPEPTHAVPDRLAVWCRILRVVFGRAETGSPVEVMGKVYRLTDRIAARMGKEPVTRTPATDLAAAMRGLEVVIAWCEALSPMFKPKQDKAV